MPPEDIVSAFDGALSRIPRDVNAAPETVNPADAVTRPEAAVITRRLVPLADSPRSPPAFEYNPVPVCPTKVTPGSAAVPILKGIGALEIVVESYLLDIAVAILPNSTS